MSRSPLGAAHLRTEWRDSPLGIDELRPRLSWWCVDERPGARQTAYRVRVASSPEGLETPDLWDSGVVASSQQTEVVYAGLPLSSRVRATWDVTLWDGEGVSGTPSSRSTFELGLLSRDDWFATWISTTRLPQEASQTRPPPPAGVLHKQFTLERPVVSARLYATALGMYDGVLNGTVIGERWLRPGWTDYRKRVQYQTYDVTSQLVEGRNTLAVTLGDGWFSGRIGMDDPVAYGDDCPSLLLQLEVLHPDGARTVVTTDSSWTWSPSPITGQDTLDGERYDARITPHAGTPVRVRDWPATALVAQPDEGVRAVLELTPVADPQPVTTQSGRIAYVFDLGQNFAGVPRLSVTGPEGAVVTLRFAEMLDADGTLYTENLRTAACTDTYTLRGDSDGETWTPRLTFHGFRYVELSHDDSWSCAVDRSTITGVVLSSLADVTGTFTCSDQRLNQLQSNTQWGQRSNFLEVPTDCPQRDERLGWTGDAQVFAPTAAFNMNVAAFFTKWARDLDDCQLPDGQTLAIAPYPRPGADGGPGWSDARVLCGWAMYLAYGDRRTLERHYAPMSQWLRWEAATAKDGIRCGPGWEHFEGFGDHLSLDEEGVHPVSPTPKDFIGTAQFASTAGVMSQIAQVLGRTDDAAEFESFREIAVEAFKRTWVTTDGLTVNTQTAQLMALAWDLLPEHLRPPVLTRLLDLLEQRDWHLSTGFLGTPLLCPVLTRFGRTDVAYRVLLNDDYPGWLFPVRNGATTVWERWNSWTPDAGFAFAGMNSFNHYAYGAVGAWIYETIGGLGIDVDRPGYERVLIAPQPDPALTWAECEHLSPRGAITTRWERQDDTFVLDVSVPANATASVRLPDGTGRDVSAGRHHFTCAYPSL